MQGETIFALASGAGRAAIAVLRLSGPATAAALRQIAGRLPQPREATLRRLRDPCSDATLDRGLVLWFPAPRSYTGEDSAELHLHGGRAVIAAVAAALLGLGLRPAEPGEFTRRAFVNGRLDLTAAEGVADLIAADTEAQRRQALRQADGALGRIYAAWTTRLIALLARQEAFIEFEDEDLPADLDGQVAAAAAALHAEIARHLAEGARSERLRDGLSFAILGAPNAGKSSLLNALAGRDAAIVSARAGTTRDIVEVTLDLGGVPVTLADTAGLRDSADEIEAEGVRRALARAEAADLSIVLFASDQPPDAASEALIARLPPADVLVVASKCDLMALASAWVGAVSLRLSARTGEGMAGFRARLAAEAAARAGWTSEAGLTRARHRAALEDARRWLDSVPDATLPEVRAEALRAAMQALGRITGAVGIEAVLDIVFGEFCIGK